ncbi:PA0069 family radical SAM protein [Sphingomonas sp. PvP056]|uniref:PA0069 family radical SAM protein n=1 Tax=Sphingomonas sp. PvP056 TaxID=3156392 RepID=UPI0033977443
MAIDSSKRAMRGATRNVLSTRFGLTDTVADGDWLDARDTIDGPASAIGTSVQDIRSRTILSYNSSPDVPFDRSINPFVGCEHGCIYCFARPTHAYHDLSPGLDFETKLFVKRDAAQILEGELRRKGYDPKPIALGANTDPYQPIERDYRVTRAILEVLAKTNHPVTITTKSDRVVRDIDLLAPMAEKGLVAVAVSVTSLVPQIAMTIEPRAPHPLKRLQAVRQLADAGIPAYVNMAPVIPAITDDEIEAIVARAAEAGASNVSYIPVRLPLEVAPLFRAWLDTHFPDRAAKVMTIIQSLRGGRDNDPNFFSRMRGEGPWADLLRTRFRIAKSRHGFPSGRRVLGLRCDLFQPPAGPQGELF